MNKFFIEPNSNYLDLVTILCAAFLLKKKKKKNHDMTKEEGKREKVLNTV